MTLISTGNLVQWPGLCGLLISSAPGLTTSQTLTTASGHYDGVVLQAPYDMVVSHIAIRTGAAVGSPTADVSIQAVSAADGSMTGVFGTNTNATTATLTTNGWTLTALTAAATIPRGSYFGVKILANGGTSVVTQRTTNMDASAWNLPYLITNTSGSVVITRGGHSLLAALGSSTTAFYNLPCLRPLTAVTAGTFDNTNAAERGLRFQVPFKCRAVGVRWYNGAAVGNCNAVLRNDAGTELSSSSTAWDGTLSAANAGALNNVLFDNAVTLETSTWYRVTIQPSEAVNSNITTITLPSADYRTGWPGGGNILYTTYVTDTWTDSATSTLPMLDLLLDQVDDGTGAGGLKINPGMNGGLI